MESSPAKKERSHEELEAIISRDKEKRARNRPDWAHLAKASLPDLHRSAQHLLQELSQQEVDAEEKTTTPERWTLIERQFRETLPEAMTFLDALAVHVDIWTECNPHTIAELLRDATTEQERLDVVLGTHLRPLLERAQETTRPRRVDSGYDTDTSVIFVLEKPQVSSISSMQTPKKTVQTPATVKTPDAAQTPNTAQTPSTVRTPNTVQTPDTPAETPSKSALKRRRKKLNRRARLAAEALVQTEEQHRVAEADAEQGTSI